MRANPKLVAYLRAHLPQFGEDALREKLLEEDVSEEEIAAALAEARRPSRRPSRLVRAALSVALGILVFLVLYEEEKPEEKKTKSAPQAPAKPAAFIGRYGYLLRLPDGYAAESVLRDMGQTEVVYIYPAKLDHSHFANEGLYGALGLLRLEVSPREFPKTLAGASSLRASVTSILSRRGEVFTSRDVLIGGLPGFVVNVTKPFPSARSFLLGAKSQYVLFGGAEDRLFTQILESIDEGASPTP